jgi:hypothetical protein
MSDDAFLAAVSATSDQHCRFCLGIRAAIAKEGRTNSALVFPSDNVADYDKLGMLCPLLIDSVIVIEREVGLKTNPKWLDSQKLDPVAAEFTVEQYLRFFMDNWTQIVADDP